jgi:hypothetical protein
LKKSEYRIDPENYFIKKERVAEYKIFEVIKSGDPAIKVDIVFIPEGYTIDEMNKFRKNCERFAGYLFNCSPFKENKNKLTFGESAPSIESN